MTNIILHQTLAKFIQAKYIEVDKGYSGKRPRTTCRITPAGRATFEAYVDALRSYTE